MESHSLQVLQDRIAASVQAWETINLSSLQPLLDQQGLQIVENQQLGIQSRKGLAEKTKEFIKIPEENKLNQIKSLIKSYQNEIDSITQRCKMSEQAFIDLYKLLADVPDPVTTLSAAKSELIEMRKKSLEHDKLVHEIEMIKSELTAAQIRLEASDSQIKEFTKLNQEKDKTDVDALANLNKQLIEQKESFKLTLDNKTRQFKEREHALEIELNMLKDQVSLLHADHKAVQESLQSNTERYGQDVAGKLAELDIAVMDIERLNHKIAELSEENRILTMDIKTLELNDKLSGHNDSSLSSTVNDLQDKIDLLQSELRKEQSSNESLKLEVSKHKDESQEIKRILDREGAKKQLEIEQLKTELSRFDDYDEIKREVEIFKSIEFSSFIDVPSIDPEQFSTTDIKVANSAKVPANQSLEHMLLVKNKKLQSDLTESRVKEMKSSNDLENIQTKMNKLLNEDVKKSSLISKLEEDLLKMNNSNVESIDTNKDSERENTEPITLTNNDKSIVPILTSQRDRFRTKVHDLELELEKHSNIESDLRQQVSQLRDDNMKLYERMRYESNFGSNSINKNFSGPSSPTSPIEGFKSRESEGRKSSGSRGDISIELGDITSRYHNAYEGKLDPFRRFYKNEEVKRIRSMNPADKLVYEITRLILNSQKSRWLFVAYVMALHLMAMIIIYSRLLSSTEMKN